MRFGIAGLPNVGKSLLFNILTKSKVLSANYPFATKNPNIANAILKDRRLDLLQKEFKSKEIIYSSVEVIDIAGIVEGASENIGLGNAFLSHVNSVDALIIVLRTFDNPDIINVMDTIDPVRDFVLLMEEFRLYDINVLEKTVKKKPELKQELDKILNRENVTYDQLITSKPILILCNGPANDELCSHIEETNLTKPKNNQIHMSQLDFNSLKEEDIFNIISQQFKNLNLITYFTAGPIETRAWRIVNGTTAENAGAVIHSSFPSKFIKAEVSKLSTPSIKSFKNKNYIVEDADIITFILNK